MSAKKIFKPEDSQEVLNTEVLTSEFSNNEKNNENHGLNDEKNHVSRSVNNILKPTKLIITQEEGKALNQSDGSIFNTKDLKISRTQPWENLPPYYKFSDLSKTSDIEILLETEKGLEEINLPKKMLDNIAKFLREDSKPRNHKFDCSSFAHFVNDIPYEFSNFFHHKWEIKLIKDKKNLNSGDTIFISESEDLDDLKITHFAIYLGNNLYISKFGNAGKLMVTNLEEMKKGFGGRFCFQAIPRKEYQDTSL
jgi:hypothetical protein